MCINRGKKEEKEKKRTHATILCFSVLNSTLRSLSRCLSLSRHPSLSVSLPFAVQCSETTSIQMPSVPFRLMFILKSVCTVLLQFNVCTYKFLLYSAHSRVYFQSQSHFLDCRFCHTLSPARSFLLSFRLFECRTHSSFAIIIIFRLKRNNKEVK